MLETIIFKSFNVNSYPDLTILVVNPPSDQLLKVRDITGIEPVTAAINSKAYAQDGDFYIGSRIGKRNIVIKFGLNTSGGYSSVSAARALIYGYMMTKRPVLLEFITDDHEPLQISGYVESLTPDRFTEDPAMQVSIICPVPDFLAVGTKEVSGVAGVDSDEVAISYLGNLPTGFSFMLDMADVDYQGEVILEMRIGDSQSVGQRFAMYDDVAYIGDDHFWIITELGNKTVEIRRGSGDIWSTINILGQMDPESTWMYLTAGINRFRVLTPYSDTPRPWTMTYTEHYGGI